MENPDIRISPGHRGRKVMPSSEVCLHMKVADKEMRFELLDKQYPMVQLLNDDGTPFSFPILTGEAGIYEDSEGYYYRRKLP